MFQPNLVTKTGMCKFCGQYHALKVPESFTEEQVNEEAIKYCSCPEAEEYQSINEMVASAESQIKKLFSERKMKVIEDLLLSSVEPMARQKIQKLSISSGEYTISMKRKRSSIEVSIKVVTEEKVES